MAVLAGTKAVGSDQPFVKHFFQRGVSLVADRAPFGSERTHRLLRELAGKSVDSIAIVIHGVDQRPIGDREGEAEIEVLVRRAHLLGMKVMLKPHHRPCESDLASESNRQAWFGKHGEGIERLGRLASRIHMDLYCVGYEMGRASVYDAEWRDVIRRARRVYPGPLTVCPSQGEQFESITFWDALDYVGIDNDYPLPDSYDYSDIVKKLERVHERYQKPVILTEVGFASTENAHRAPWAEPIAKLSMEEQTRCYQAVFEALYQKPWFMGMYWWKVDTDGFGSENDRSLTPWKKPAMGLVQNWYSSDRRR